MRGMTWIELAQDRDRLWALVNKVIRIPVTEIVENFLTSSERDNFSARTLLH